MDEMQQLQLKLHKGKTRDDEIAAAAAAAAVEAAEAEEGLRDQLSEANASRESTVAADGSCLHKFCAHTLQGGGVMLFCERCGEVKPGIQGGGGSSSNRPRGVTLGRVSESDNGDESDDDGMPFR